MKPIHLGGDFHFDATIMRDMDTDITSRLAQAAEQQADYLPNSSTRKQIADKTLIMVIAPTSMGKTYVMNKVIELNDDFARVTVLTTRDPRPDDRGMFRYYQRTNEDFDRLLRKIERRELVQYAIFPSSGQVYGSEPQDFPARFNLLATLSNSVEQLEHVGFTRTIPIGLITYPKVWMEWFDARYTDRKADRPARLREALQSLDWLLDHDVRWLINEPGRVNSVAKKLIAIAEKSTGDEDAKARTYARQLRAHIAQMIDITEDKEHPHEQREA